MNELAASGKSGPRYLSEVFVADPKTGSRVRSVSTTFRATGITAYLKNGGKLEVAQQMAAHESSRTTGLEVSPDEVERIGI